MKAKYLFGVTLCCTLMIACQTNDPNKNEGNDDKTNTEISNRLKDMVDGIGNIIDSKTLEDGSITLTDDKGNTITKDKDGNITIVTKDGETILIDNSIYEDTSIPRDKWYRSTWKARKHIYGESYIDLRYDFIQKMQYFGFDIHTSFIEMDSTTIFNDSVEYINLYFNTTTCSWQYLDTLKEITQTGIYRFTKYHITEQQLEYYTLKIEKDVARIYTNENMMVAYCPINQDSTISIASGYNMTDKTEKILKTGVNTAFFNYRRINDTQIAVINNSSSYLLIEKNSSNLPKMETYKDGYEQHIDFELVSL